MESEPLVSCLCVTEDRQAFMPWLLWGFTRQTWPNKELVIVDSSREPSLASPPPGVRVIRTRPGALVSEKRNLALEHAAGKLVAWFDDDDWQHPERLARLVPEIRDGAVAAGARDAWFLDLWNQRCRRYSGSEIIFNGALFERDAARSERFDPTRVRGSDTVWLRALAARHGSAFRPVDALLFSWLVHERNLSNSRARRQCWTPTSGLATRIGDELWTDTELELERLRQRLRHARGQRAVAPAVLPETRDVPKPLARSMPAIVGSWGGRGGSALARPRPRVELAQPVTVNVAPSRRADAVPRAAIPVSAFVKATVLDVPYIETMARHMLEQARYSFAERVLVIDPRREFSGKYRGRARFDRAALDGATARMLGRGIVDRVVVVPYDAASVESVLRRYFGPQGHKVPTHAVTGGPIYPTLFGLEHMSSDFVVQFDGDMFFNVAGGSWIEAALDVLQTHPDVWFAMLHGGPPAGAAHRAASLGPLNARRSSWDENARGWRFSTVSTRYFLTDRRRLRDRVPIVRRGPGVLPLEQCLSVGLARHHAARIALPGTIGWDLHAHSHAAPFADWAAGIAELVQRGIVGSPGTELEFAL